MKSVMEHQFSQVPRADIPRSSFNRSFGLKTTFDADYLIPIFVEDVIPGSSHNVKASFFARLATPLHPIMDNMYLDTFFFFVPYRLVWENWEKFCGAQEDPGDSIDYTIPVLTGANTHTGEGSLWDYFGLPLINGAGGVHFDPDDLTVSALPWRAYHLIYNDWFRDQNLQDSWVQFTDDGPDSLGTNEYTAAHDAPAKRGKRHDYFTSALPWPAKGSSVSMPLGTQAPVTGIGVKAGATAGSIGSIRETPEGPTVTYADGWSAGATDAGTIHIEEGSTADYPNIYADLTNATAATINDIRLAFQTQRLLERDARSGTRYVETLKAHFGVTSPDFRLQRPEFLGGGSSRINITPVAQQNTQDATNDPATTDRYVGQLGGFGTVSGTHSFTKSFVEHGVIIGLANARADLTYSQGLERYWSKQTRYDFYYPVLSSIGEQSILNKELWADGSANDELVFGYTERYNEYRYKPSKLTGLMRPDASGTLATWHLSEDFATLPTLGSDFITANLSTPLDRAIAISTEPHFIADFYFDYKCAQPMPMYGIPGSLDHF